MKRTLVVIISAFLTFSCGGNLQNNSDAPQKLTSEYKRGALVFDPFSKEGEDKIGVPFPNDILLSASREDSYLYFDPQTAKNEETKALYEALNELKLKGFSPNMPIFIPLASKVSLDAQSVKSHFKLVDLTALFLSSENPTYASLIDQSQRLTFRQEGDFLKFYPVEPLEAGHKYLFLLTKGIKDIYGNEVLPPSIFLELEKESPLENQQLEGIRQSYKPLFDSLLPKLGLDRNSVLELFTFTVADKTLSTSDFNSIKAFLNGEADSLNVTGISYSNISQDYGLIDGAVDNVYGLISSNTTLGNYLKSVILQGKFPAFDISKIKEMFETLQQSPSEFDVKNYAKFIPVYFVNRNSYNGTVYIFQHGLGGSKERVEALKEDIPIPAVAIDLPFHGDYTKLTENSEFECGEGKCFLTGNPVNNRLNIYQAVFNLRLLEKLLREGFYDINGDGTPDTPQKVNFLGVSMGAIVGSIYAKFGTPDRVVLNVGGANYSSIVDSATNELIEKLLESTGVKKNTYAYGYMLGITQLLQDPSDPALLGQDNHTSVILQTAYGDTVVPNVSSEVLARRLGFSKYLTVSENSTVNATSGWYMFGDKNNWCIHGFLIHTDIQKYPEALPHLNESYVRNLQVLARKQVNDFFTSP